MNFTWVGSKLFLPNVWLGWKGLPRTNTNLLQKLVNYDHKKFCNIFVLVWMTTFSSDIWKNSRLRKYSIFWGKPTTQGTCEDCTTTRWHLNLKISIMPPDAECSYADCHVIPIVMLSVIMLTVNMLSAIMVNVIMVSVAVPQNIPLI
jgi:hypothetical protein